MVDAPLLLARWSGWLAVSAAGGGGAGVRWRNLLYSLSTTKSVT